MTTAFWTRVQPWLMGLMLVLSLGLLLKGWIDDEVDRRARRAFEQRAEKLVIAAFPEWPAARVTGVQTVLFGGVGPVCGWVDDGRNAALPFRVDPPLDDYPDVALIIAKPHVGSPEERAQQAFAKQLILRLCEIDRDFTSPPNAARDPAVDLPLSTLWETPEQDWAVVPARGAVGFHAIARRPGGGSILSPVVESESEARSWIATIGSAQLTEASARWAKESAEMDACFERRRRERSAEKC